MGILEKAIMKPAQPMKKIPFSKETKGTVQCSCETVIGPYSEPVELHARAKFQFL
jgi:hypothetical protein